jgi:hypothetical protein
VVRGRLYGDTDIWEFAFFFFFFFFFLLVYLVLKMFIFFSNLF